MEFKKFFNWLLPDYKEPYSILDDLKTHDDIINFDNAVFKSRKEKIKINVSLSSGKVISVKGFTD